MPQNTPRVPVEIDGTIDPTLGTGRAGSPLVIELFRQLGVAQTIDAEVAVEQRQRGLTPAELSESLSGLWASGGDRGQDLTRLREDQALAALLGHPLLAATTGRDFLAAFPVEHGPLWVAGPQATIPEESAPLGGRGRANRTLVAGLQRGARDRRAPLDVDAPLVESHQDAATVAYDGTRGSQPVVVRWAEQDVILQDPFRAGHVPAGCGNVRVVQQAVATLPQGIPEIRLRADSALDETAALRWCEEADPKIAYASRADLSEQFKAEIRRLPESAWQGEREEPEAIRAWAEVPDVPDDGDHRNDRPCIRRYLAVLQGHREKAGPGAHAHHVLKNELAAAALPSGKFGANAAWFRLNVLTANLLTALKRWPFPGALRTARPTRRGCLRFNTVGKVVPHVRRTLLRRSAALPHAFLRRVRRKIARLAPA